MNECLNLIIGSTGRTGRRIMQRLADKGHLVREASRHSDTPFDWDRPETWDAALDGITSAYICYSPDLAIPGATGKIRTFVDRAVQHNVQRLVLLSGRGEEEAQAAERFVQRVDVNWTIVRCAWFCQNFTEGPFLEGVLSGEIALPAGEVGEPFIDVDDIADVVVAALTEEGHAGQVYELTGPRLLTFGEAVREIAEATGHPIHYLQISTETFAASVANMELPGDIAWLLEYLFSTVLDGRNASIEDGVERALGRKPRDFSDFCRVTVAAGIWSFAE
ncbi:MAG: NAD(P)H-binding protein [Pseudomonadales bacterium]|nr:NAD(P)H-binding protein [Pseudomonadales bacterium]